MNRGMAILHITCSARGVLSFSGRLSALIVERLAGNDPTARVTLRALGSAPPPHADGAYAQALAGRPAEATAGGSLALSDQLIAEVEAADAIVIGTPMHNYTVPSCLKAWIDHVVRIGRSFSASAAGKQGLLPDRPVYIAVASGGLYQGQDASALQPDFLTPYLRAALGTIGLKSLHFLPLQGTVRSEEAVAGAWREAVAALDLLMAHTA
ncbi:MAG: NAD(P)H-dependent oxidoreductase [Pseudomonadota bacterium]